MSLRKQDFCVSVAYILGYSLFRNVLLSIQKRPVARFVTFHDVPSVTAEIFERKIRFLKQKTNVVTIDDYLAGKLSNAKVNTVITFDDGYEGWINHAVPILEKHRLPATFFVSSWHVLNTQTGQNHRAETLPRGVGISEEMLKTLAKRGFTIGGHTHSHCNLSKITEPEELLRELSQNRNFLESMLGGAIRYFAYPFGVYRNPKFDVPALVRTSGYQAALTLISGFNESEKTDPFLLRREITGASMSPLAFKARVYGNYDLVNSLKSVLHRGPKTSALPIQSCTQTCNTAVNS